MSRLFSKAGIAFIAALGLTGGLAGSPIAFADESSASIEQVSAADVRTMMDKLVAARPNVTPESWIASGADSELTIANLELQAQSAFTNEELLNRLKSSYDVLVPGENLTTFMNPTDDTVRGANVDDHNNSDLMRAYWVDGKPGNRPGYREFMLSNAVNGIAKWGRVNEDGSPSYAGTAKLGAKGAKRAVYIQFDLEKSATIKNFRIWRSLIDGASYANTALVVSDDPSFATKTVAYYSAGDDKSDVFGLGVAPADAYYTETAEGKDLLQGKQPVVGRYVRLYLNGTTNDVGGLNALLEVAITGAGKGDMTEAYDTAALEDAIASGYARLRMIEGNPGLYPAEAVASLKDSISKAEDLLARIKAGTATENLGVVSDLVASVEKAEQGVPNAYRVTFDDKIDSTENKVVEALEGAAVALPANPVHPEGHTFEGWFLDEGGETPFDPAAHTAGDITVYAKWSTPAAELKPVETVKPEAKPENGKKPVTDDKLPQTGDASMFAVAASALGSVAAFAAVRRRK